MAANGDEGCSEADSNEPAERHQALVGLGLECAGDGDHDRELPESCQLLEEAWPRGEGPIAIDLRTGEGAEAFGGAIVLEEDEARRRLCGHENKDTVWLREAETADAARRERPRPARGPGHPEGRRPDEGDQGGVHLREVREEGRDSPRRERDGGGSVRPEHRGQELRVRESRRLLLEPPQCPGEASRRRYDEPESSAALARLLPPPEPTGRLQGGEATTEARPVPAGEDESVDIGKGQDPEAREVDEDRAVARKGWTEGGLPFPGPVSRRLDPHAVRSGRAHADGWLPRISRCAAHVDARGVGMRPGRAFPWAKDSAVVDRGAPRSGNGSSWIDRRGFGRHRRHRGREAPRLLEPIVASRRRGPSPLQGFASGRARAGTPAVHRRSPRSPGLSSDTGDDSARRREKSGTTLYTSAISWLSNR